MGLSPDQVSKMSLWQAAVIIDAWNEAHADPNAPPPAMSDDEFFEMMERNGQH
jgi:uncharacterized protein YbaP (TraB family)